jgi:hypothetical protein
MYGHPRIPRMSPRRLPPAPTSRWGVSLLGFALLFLVALFFFLAAFGAYAAPVPTPCVEGVRDEALIVICFLCATSGGLVGLVLGCAALGGNRHAPRQ